MRDATHYGRWAPDVPVDQLARIAPSRFATVPLDPDAPTGGDALHASANHGRWVVRCPDCGNAQLTHPADPRFLCNDCGNVGNGRLFRPVVWPKDHEAIGALLDEREDPSLRNWSPGETVAALTRENGLLDGSALLADWMHPQWFDPKKPHTHHWPKLTKAVAPSDVLECRDCGLPETAKQVYPEAFA